MRVGLVCENAPDDLGDDEKPSFAEYVWEDEEDQMLAALYDAGHEVVRIGDVHALLSALERHKREVDVVLNRSGVGSFDQVLLAAAVLEAAAIPYSGSAPYAMGLARHKWHTRLVAESAGVPVPEGVLCDGRAEVKLELEKIRYPAIVKPVGLGASLGIDQDHSIVDGPTAAFTRAELLRARFRHPAIVETFIFGTEVGVGVILAPDARGLGTAVITDRGEPLAPDRFLSAESIWGLHYGFARTPPQIDDQQLMELASRACAALGLRDYARADFRVDEEGKPWLFEVNGGPEILRHSSYMFCAEQSGFDYVSLLDHFVRLARSRG
jgi:D-alanine-D-alanine ligase